MGLQKETIRKCFQPTPMCVKRSSNKQVPKRHVRMELWTQQQLPSYETAYPLTTS